MNTSPTSGPFTRNRLKRGDLPAVVCAKWNESVLDEGFVPFPKRLVRTLSRVFTGQHALQDLALVLAVADYARPNLTRQPSIEYLAFLAGLSTDDAKARLSALSERGLAQVRLVDGTTEVRLDGLHRLILDLSSE